MFSTYRTAKLACLAAAHVTMGPAEDDLSFQLDVEDGWSVQVRAGTWHDIINTGDEDMRLYVVYAPVHHTPASSRRPLMTPRRTRSRGATSLRPGRYSRGTPSRTRRPEPWLIETIRPSPVPEGPWRV
jgi:hypothetical protein